MGGKVPDGNGPEAGDAGLGVWRPVRDEVVLKTPVFDVVRRLSVSPKDGREKAFSCLVAPSWANVLAVTPEGSVVMVRQFRHGTGEVSLELPGGVVERGQTPRQAAERELMEETGYSAEGFEELCALRPNPALFGNTIRTFLATGARRSGETSFDENEQLALELVPGDELGRMILDGRIDHALMVAAIGLWLARRERS